MTRLLEYESETVMPEPIIESIEKCEKYARKDRYEIDKILLHLHRMRHEIILYFANNSIGEK